MLKHFVEFSFHGAFLSEYQVKEVTERNPELVTVPEGAFAYRFFDRTETSIDGEVLVGERKNISPLTYIGKEYTLEEVKDQFPECHILISNMEVNGWSRVVKTRCGNWQPLLEGDIVI